MRAVLAVLAFTFAAGVPAAHAQPDWPFTVDFGSYLLHVHPELNYSLHPEWLAVWERERLRSGAFRGTFGSSATDELLIDVRWALNTDLGAGLRLRQDVLWQERRHLPHDRLAIWLGLEQQVRRGLAAVAQSVLASRKDAIDLRLGGLWTSDDRARYVQLLYVVEDLIHDAKDRRGGVTRTSPRGLDWLVRLERGPWTLYTQGYWVRGFARDYPDSARSPDLARRARTDRDLTARLRWRPASRTMAELSYFQAENAELNRYREGPGSVGWTEFDHDYAGWYRLLSLRALYPVADRWRLRGELHRLDRRAAATGWRAFTYHRDEVLPGLWAEWAWSPRRTIELGYLGAWYQWLRRDGEAAPISDERRGFADKLELALYLGLAGEAALKLSVSHEVSFERFGGGSVRLVAPF